MGRYQDHSHGQPAKHCPEPVPAVCFCSAMRLLSNGHVAAGGRAGAYHHAFLWCESNSDPYLVTARPVSVPDRRRTGISCASRGQGREDTCRRSSCAPRPSFRGGPPAPTRLAAAYSLSVKQRLRNSATDTRRPMRSGIAFHVGACHRRANAEHDRGTSVHEHSKGLSGLYEPDSITYVSTGHRIPRAQADSESDLWNKPLP